LLLAAQMPVEVTSALLVGQNELVDPFMADGERAEAL